jgi:hypothetical protein
LLDLESTQHKQEQKCRLSPFWPFFPSWLHSQATHTTDLCTTLLHLITLLQHTDMPQLMDTTPQLMEDMDMNNQNTTAQSLMSSNPLMFAHQPLKPSVPL